MRNVKLGEKKVVKKKSTRHPILKIFASTKVVALSQDFILLEGYWVAHVWVGGGRWTANGASRGHLWVRYKNTILRSLTLGSPMGASKVVDFYETPCMASPSNSKHFFASGGVSISQQGRSYRRLKFACFLTQKNFDSILLIEGVGAHGTL